MSEPFVMKAVLSLLIIGAGLALLIWNRVNKAKQRVPLSEALLSIPPVGEDSDFERKEG